MSVHDNAPNNNVQDDSQKLRKLILVHLRLACWSALILVGIVCVALTLYPQIQASPVRRFVYGTGILVSFFILGYAVIVSGVSYLFFRRSGGRLFF